MESLIEPIRYTTTLFALATATVMARALKHDHPPILSVWAVWLGLAAAAGAVMSHVTRAVPVAALVPAIAGVGLLLGFASLASPRVAARYAALDDRQWRLLMLLRAVFGALILAAGAAGLFPLAFAAPAGLGDLLIGALAIVVPGSLATNGHRGFRLLVFGLGLLDFASVVFLQVTVLVPWLAQTHSIGISLLLPWLVVPLLATLNLAGLRQALKAA